MPQSNFCLGIKILFPPLNFTRRRAGMCFSISLMLSFGLSHHAYNLLQFYSNLLHSQSFPSTAQQFIFKIIPERMFKIEWGGKPLPMKNRNLRDRNPQKHVMPFSLQFPAYQAFFSHRYFQLTFYLSAERYSFIQTQDLHRKHVSLSYLSFKSLLKPFNAVLSHKKRHCLIIYIDIIWLPPKAQTNFCLTKPKKGETGQLLKDSWLQRITN